MDEKKLGEELELELELMNAESLDGNAGLDKKELVAKKEDSSPKREDSVPKRAVSFSPPDPLANEAVTLQKSQETPSPAQADGKRAEFLRFL